MAFSSGGYSPGRSSAERCSSIATSHRRELGPPRGGFGSLSSANCASEGRGLVRGSMPSESIGGSRRSSTQQRDRSSATRKGGDSSRNISGRCRVRSQSTSTYRLMNMRTRFGALLLGTLALVGCADIQRSNEIEGSAESVRSALASEFGVAPSMSWQYGNGRLMHLQYSFPLAAAKELTVEEFYTAVAAHVEAEFGEVPEGLVVAVTAREQLP